MMDWDELRSKWQTRDEASGPSRLERPGGAARLWQRVHSRDGLESVVAFLLIPFFGATTFFTIREGQWLAAGFAVYLVAVLIFIPWRLWRARRLIPWPDPNRPVREFLLDERAALAAQAGMLRTVSRWYYGPIAIGVVGFYAGIHGAALSTLLYAVFVVALCAFIEAANRHAVRTRFQPAIDMIDEQIHQMEEDHD